MNLIEKWNLDDLLKIDDFDLVLSEIKNEMNNWNKRWESIHPKMGQNEFKEFIEADEKLGDKISKLIYLPHLMEAVNQKDTQAKLLKGKANDLIIEYSNLTRKFGHWLKGKAETGKEILDDKEAKRLFATIPDLTYKLERTRMAEKHTLKEKEEEIITNKDINGIEVVRDLRTLIETEFEYDVIIKGKHKKIKTQSELLNLVHSTKSEVREAAYRALFEKQKQNIDKFFMIYQAIVKDWKFEKEIRGFNSPISVRNFENDISDKTIEVLLTCCQKNSNVFQKYFKYKANKLGVKKLSRFDIYAPISKEKNVKINYNQALKMVLEAYEDFSGEFAQKAKRIIDKKHIDNWPNENKQSGAFCATATPNTEPYVLLNFVGNKRDVFTMAHELGHGAHSLFAEKHFPSAQQANLPLAETASTLGEMLLMDKILSQEKDVSKRKELIAEKMDDSFATILRQSYFTLFEIRAHEAIGKGITEEDLSKIWLETLNEQFGDSVDVDPIFRYEWSYISHIFETPFYCYAYNFGELLTMSLYKRYKEDKKFTQEIEKLLSYGGSISPDKALKEIGVETEDENFWQGGFEILKEWQKELDK